MHKNPEIKYEQILKMIIVLVYGSFSIFQAKNAADKGDEQEADMFTSRATSLIIWTMFVGLCIILVSVLYVAVM